LFKCQKFQRIQSQIAMKANAALVRTDRIVVLNSIASIGPKISVIVFPIYSKNNNLIRLSKPFEYFHIFVDRSENQNFQQTFL